MERMARALSTAKVLTRREEEVVRRQRMLLRRNLKLVVRQQFKFLSLARAIQTADDGQLFVPDRVPLRHLRPPPHPRDVPHSDRVRRLHDLIAALVVTRHVTVNKRTARC